MSLAATAALLLSLAACTGAPATTPSAPPASAPTAAPMTPSPLPVVTAPPATPAPVSPSPVASAYPEGSVIVTFQVVEEEFKVLLTDPADIEIARALLAGEEAPSIPNGVVVRDDAGVNAPWSWHLDPETIEFADMTIEVCDGLPSYVEAGTITSEQFCPWSAEVTAVEPANP